MGLFIITKNSQWIIWQNMSIKNMPHFWFTTSTFDNLFYKNVVYYKKIFKVTAINRRIFKLYAVSNTIESGKKRVKLIVYRKMSGRYNANWKRYILPRENMVNTRTC